jgi:membrane fusion protein (multidrug efflux system)
VHSRNEINVLARISGKLSDLPVREGEAAKSGAILARIAAPEADARVSRLQADVARIKEESAFLCRQAEIDANLLASNAVSRVQADASRQKCESAKAAQMAAEAGLRESDVLAGNTIERAPFVGTVLKWLAEPGENVMPGRPLLLFGDEPKEVRVRVHEKDIARGIAKGSVAILLPEHPHPIRAAVFAVSPQATGSGRMIEVRIPLEGTDAVRFRHGMSVDVAFVLDERDDSLTVPAEALVRTKGETGVYRVKEDKTQWVAVKPSIREGRLVAVEGLLEPGDRVVVGNLEAVSDGLAVWPVPVEGAAP